MNICTISGRLGAHAESRTTPSGRTLTTFSVAVNRNYKRGEEWVTETTWINVQSWGRLAERASTLAKGQIVTVSGRLDCGTYETADGASKFYSRIVASEVVPGALPAPREASA